MRAPLLILGLSAACNEVTSPRMRSPGVSLVIVSGEGQSGVVGTELAQPVVVKAVDAKGKAEPGMVVNFVVTSGGGRVYSGSAITDAQGVAADYWTIGTSTRVLQRLEVRTVHSDGTKEVLGAFTANPLPGAPASLTIVNGGYSQWRRAGSAVLRSPSVRVDDQYGNPVGGVVVNFAVASGGGSVVGGSATTSAVGEATVGSWVLGPTPGSNALTATVASNPALSAQFRAIGNAGDLYVTNQSGNSVTVFAAGATDNASPKITIQGDATGLSTPAGITIDGSGNLHVVNAGTKTITTYALGATGNASPIRTIGGGNTGLTDPTAIAADAAGNLYVSNSVENGGDIVVFAAGANGNVAPIRRISGSSTGINRAAGIAIDALDRLYVANVGLYSRCCQSITVYAAGANGNAAPVRTIGGSNTRFLNPFGIALDDAGNIFVSSFGNTDAGPSNPQSTIVSFTPSQNGDVTPATTILGEGYLSEPLGLAVNVAGQIYAANLFTNTISVYPAGATGSVAPSATIGGAATGLNRPTYMTF